MKLSRKARFGITAMIRLGLREGKGTQTLSDLSMDQGISLSYLEQLFAQLRRKGLVIGVRGPGGGYRLARPAGEITLASIITAVDDQAYPAALTVTGGHAGAETGPTDAMWEDLSDQLYAFLETMTLADVINGSSNKAEAGNDDHYDEIRADKVA